MNLTPVLQGTPAIKLAAGELADGDDERGVVDFLTQAKRPRCVEFFGAVDREAVWGAAEQTAQKRDVGRVRAEMSMNVSGAALCEPPAKDTRLGQINQMPDQPALRTSTQAHRRRDGSAPSPGTAERLQNEGLDQTAGSGLQD